MMGVDFIQNGNVMFTNRRLRLKYKENQIYLNLIIPGDLQYKQI